MSSGGPTSQIEMEAMLVIMISVREHVEIANRCKLIFDPWIREMFADICSQTQRMWNEIG